MSILQLREERAVIESMIEDEARLMPALKRYDEKKLLAELDAVDEKIAEHIAKEDEALKAAQAERDLVEAEVLTVLDHLYYAREELEALAPRAKDNMKAKCFEVIKSLSQILRNHKLKEIEDGNL